MINKIQFRLLMAFILVVVVAASTASIFMSINFERQMDLWQAQQDQTTLSRAERILVRYYSNFGSWSAVQPIIEQTGQFYGRRMILTDSNGTVVGDSQDELLNKTFTFKWKGQTIPSSGPIKIGVLYMSPLQGQSPEVTVLMRQVNFFLVIGAILAICVAGFIIVFLSNYISKPIRALTSAAGVSRSPPSRCSSRRDAVFSPRIPPGS